MRKLFVLLFICLASSSFGQKITAGFSTGTELFRIEGGYQLNEKIVVGAYYTLGFNKNGSVGDTPLKIPSAFGGFGRYLFNESDLIDNGFFEIDLRPYAQISLGIIQGSKINYDTLEEENELGYRAAFGVDFLYGRNNSFATFFELGVGKTPNYWASFEDFLSSPALDPSGESSLTSTLSFAVGFRFYL